MCVANAPSLELSDSCVSLTRTLAARPHDTTVEWNSLAGEVSHI
jgi:hypothetical protein